ncbi:MAG: hypothetical protein GKR87_11900 [Kiritimatiellae bacterium]|nr:hypothetical protein [Kiritimatiellia bacterium]
MKSTVYIETSVVSYYTGRPSRDLVIAARQQQTNDWWANRLPGFDVFVSNLVLEEVSTGDPNAVGKRLLSIEDIPLLDLTEDVFSLSEVLLKHHAIPKEYPEDALHIAVSAVHGIDYLLTWNFTHINNAETKSKIEKSVWDYGYECSVICTPEELMGG